MKMTKKEKRIFDKYFGVYVNKYNNDFYYELESWTAGGVDMIISLDTRENETITKQFIDFIENFDVDEEIEIYRQDKRYCEHFTIRESLNDFDDWLSWLNEIKTELCN